MLIAIVGKVMERLVMDVLSALRSPVVVIQEKTLELALELVTVNNVKEIVATLKKELLRSQASDFENGEAFRQRIVRAVHQVLRFAVSC